MTATQLLIRWIAVTVFTIANGLWQGKTLVPNLLLIAVFSATALTGLAALGPLTQLPGWSGLGIEWIRRFLIMGIVWGVMMGTPLLHTTMASFAFATMFTIDALIKRNKKA